MVNLLIHNIEQVTNFFKIIKKYVLRKLMLAIKQITMNISTHNTRICIHELLIVDCPG